MNKFAESIVKGVIVAGLSTGAVIAIGAVERMWLHHGKDNEPTDISDEKTEPVFEEAEEA